MSTNTQGLQEVAFFEWFTANSGKINPGTLGLKIFPDTGRGAYALRDIRETEVLFEIPREMVLSTRTSDLPRLLGEKDWADVGPGWAGLILCMMYEESKGPTSKWAGYFATLPTTFSTLMFWSPEELKELQGSTIIEKIGREEAEADYYNRVIPVIQRRADLFEPSLLPTMFSLERYHINGSRILSRSFEVQPDIPGKNEDWESAAGPSHEIEVASDGGSEEGQQDNVDHVGMTPFADLLNARYGCENAHLCYDNALQMIATEDIPAGSQIWNTYGEPPNSDLLRRYGHVDFVPTPEGYLGNPMDVVEIRADLIVDVVKAPESAERVEFFLDNGGEDSFEIFYQDTFGVPESDSRDVGVPKPRDEMLGFINLLLLPIDLFHKAKTKSKLPKPTADVACLRVLLQVLVRRIAQYSTSIEEDEEILKQIENSQNLTNAVIVRLGEKRILQQTLLNLKDEIASLEERANRKNRRDPAEDSNRRSKRVRR